MQALSAGVAGELAEEVLVAGGLAVVVVFVIEARTGQGYVAGFRMPGLAPTQFRPQGFDQPAAAQDAREGVPIT